MIKILENVILKNYGRSFSFFDKWIFDNLSILASNKEINAVLKKIFNVLFYKILKIYIECIKSDKISNSQRILYD